MPRLIILQPNSKTFTATSNSIISIIQFQFTNIKYIKLANTDVTIQKTITNCGFKLEYLMPNYLQTSKKISQFRISQEYEIAAFQKRSKYKLLCIINTAIYKQTPSFIATHIIKYSNKRILRFTNKLTLNAPDFSQNGFLY